jgi:hypothetical protein
MRLAASYPGKYNLKNMEVTVLSAYGHLLDVADALE